MIPIAVFSGDEFVLQLEKNLKRFFTVSVVTQTKVRWQNADDLGLIECRDKAACSVKSGFIVIAENMPEKCRCFTLLTDSADSLPEVFENTQCLICGMNSRDTVSFSSLSDTEASVCFLREITDIAGNRREPFELVMKSQSRMDRYAPFYLLCLASLLVLCGREGLPDPILIE